MAVSKLPNIAFVRECLDYNPDTGVFTWRERPREHFPNDRIWRAWNGRLAGKVTGFVAVKRPGQLFVSINLDNRSFKAHRLAWLLVHGRAVPRVIDHINGDPCDNRTANLRAATKSTNAVNSPAPANNTSGVKGVFHHPKRYPATPFMAYISIRGKRHHLGYFRTLEEAAEARRKAAVAFYGEYARHD